MRDFLLASIIALALAAASAMPVDAQTRGDQRALDSLGPPRNGHRGAAHTHHHAKPVHPGAARAAAPQTAAVAVPSPTPAPTPVIPAAPPPPPAIKAPAIDVPLHPEPPPPPVPVVAGATGAASEIEGGSRITFGDDSADLNPATMQALQDAASRLRADPGSRADIDAYARGTADDPSTPRRLSLQRGLAARAVLINAGIPSTRIYVRAVGLAHDAGPADRIDLTHAEGPPQAPPSTSPGIKAATTP